MTHSGVPMLTTYWKKVYNILTSVVETLMKEPTLKLYESREELVEDVKDDGHKLPSHPQKMRRKVEKMMMMMKKRRMMKKKRRNKTQ